MASTLKKTGPKSAQPDYRNNGTAVEIERATETMMAYVGYLNTEIMAEEALDKPNQEKIEAMQLQLETVLKERKIIITDRKLVTKALFVYAPIVKALNRA